MSRRANGYSGKGQPVSADLTWGAGSLRLGEPNHCLRTREVLVECLRLALEEHVAFGIQD
jgi:hypothetical protein